MYHQNLRVGMQEVNSCSKLRASFSPYPLPLFFPLRYRNCSFNE